MLDDRAAARQLAFLERVVRATAEQADHDQLLRRIIDEATEATDTQVCSLYLWDETEKVLVLTATNGLAQSGVGQVRLGLGEGVTGWVAAQRRATGGRRRARRAALHVDCQPRPGAVSVDAVGADRLARSRDWRDERPDNRRACVTASRKWNSCEVLAAQVAGIIELSVLRQRQARQLTLEHEAVERLTSLNASKSDLLAMLSHDFRGPLSIAKSYVFGLMARLSGPDLEACRELESELDSLARMTDNLMLSLELEAQHQLVLDLERVRPGRPGPTRFAAAFGGLARSIRHFVRPERTRAW